MPDKFFLDTNLFVYSFDTTAPAKQRRAQALIREGITQRHSVTSTQVVQEFLHVATRKFAVPMTAADCREYIGAVFTPLCEVFPTLALYDVALRIMDETRYHLYDALIVAGAVSSESTVLLSEDLQDGRVVHGVRIHNPFAKAQ